MRTGRATDKVANITGPVVLALVTTAEQLVANLLHATHDIDAGEKVSRRGVFQIAKSALKLKIGNQANGR